MLHDPSHIPQIPAEQEIVLSGSEKDILRRLGSEIATIGSLPGHQEKALFGINNIMAGDSPSEIKEGIKEVVNSIRRKMPDTKILLPGSLPTGIKKDASSRLCYDVVQQNLALVKFDKSVTFKNIGASFIVKDGSLGLYFMILIFTACKTPSAIQQTNNSVLIPASATESEIVRLAANVTPSARQQAWQEMEFTAFFCFTVNTFTDREWGEGTESPSVFNPTALDARQWVKTAKDAGIKLVILTCKHHDGFCLWPSKFTEHSVKNSSYKNGKGDLVKEVAEACKELGVKFGVYLSPWDRHEKTYGDSPAYNQFFNNQLTELLSNYGDITEVWFDGACGEGSNGKKQVYDWKSYYSNIRKLQPHAVIAVMGPDVRWVGTESGYGRETEWSVVPASSQSLTDIAANSQQKTGDGTFLPPGDMRGIDLGSRAKIATAKGLIWYPSEVDVSIRPGWFYHSKEDDNVKSPEKLLDIYFSSVGRNSLLLLNIPPDRRGLLHENDVRNLQLFKKMVDDIFATNYLSGAKITSDSQSGKQKAEYCIDADNQTWWAAAPDKSSALLEATLTGPQTFNVLMLQENIQIGQRIESFILEGWVNGSWQKLCEGTTVGYKRLLRFDSVTTDRVRLRITGSRLNPTLSSFGLYLNKSEMNK